MSRDILPDIAPASRVSMHASNDDARHWRFERRSGLPHGYFDTRAERVGVATVSITMWLVAAFIALGLAFGWFA